MLTLGQLIKELEAAKPDTPVYYDFAMHVPTRVDSYRGYYDKPALGWDVARVAGVPNRITAVELIAELKEATDRMFGGWKGGEYWYSLSDELYIDNPGESSGIGITRVEDLGYRIILHTVRVE